MMAEAQGLIAKADDDAPVGASADDTSTERHGRHRCRE